MSYLIIRLNSLFKLNEVPDRKVLCAILNVLNINTLSSCENIQGESRRSRHFLLDSILNFKDVLHIYYLLEIKRQILHRLYRKFKVQIRTT